MKKFFALLCLTSLVLTITSPLMAAGIVNKQNFSAEYLRTFSRNAATDSADVVAFNPAGVMKMENGFYGNFSVFYALKNYSNIIGNTVYESDEPSIVPGMFALLKKDRWAAFAALTIPAGGGEVKYPGGNATTFGYGIGLTSNPFLNPPYDVFRNQFTEAESIYYGYTFGGAYAINDVVSVAAGARYIDANKEAKASLVLANSLGLAPLLPVALEYEETADGWGGFIGINISPEGPFNIGLHYETKTRLDFTTRVTKDTVPGGGMTDGKKEREDLPGLIGAGISYKINSKLKVDTSLTYYLEKNADWQKARLRDAGNTYDLAIAFEYAINPRLRASIGYMYTTKNITPENMQPEAAELDANTLCGGIVYEAMKDLFLNFSIMKTFYDKETASMSYGSVGLEKEITGLGFGIQYKFK